jgi:hypothetical protein
MSEIVTCAWWSTEVMAAPACASCGAVLPRDGPDDPLPGLTVTDLTEVRRSQARTADARSASRVLRRVADVGFEAWRLKDWLASLLGR